jgi:hypothetical protein
VSNVYRGVETSVLYNSKTAALASSSGWASNSKVSMEKSTLWDRNQHSGIVTNGAAKELSQADLP